VFTIVKNLAAQSQRFKPNLRKANHTDSCSNPSWTPVPKLLETSPDPRTHPINT